MGTAPFYMPQIPQFEQFGQNLSYQYVPQSFSEADMVVLAQQRAQHALQAA